MCDGETIKFYDYATDSTSHICSTEGDGTTLLGSNSHRWYRLYQTASSVSTSDEREKSNITAISDYPINSEGDENILEKLFDKLIPKTYTLNTENTDEVHIGFVAQDLAQSMKELGLSEDKMGIIIHDYWNDEKTNEKKDRYGLAYEEFIALNTYMIQKQRKTIDDQQKQIAELTERIELLENTIHKQ